LAKEPVTWIITVNYRTPALTIDSLAAASAQRNALGQGQFLVVDNASGDGSAETIDAAIKRNGWDSWASVCPQSQNGGFSFGNNRGFLKALASNPHIDYFLLLNPDALMREGALEKLIAFMEQHPRAGIAGSRIENQDGGIERSAHQFHSPLSELLAGAQLGILDRMFPKHVVTPALRDEAHRCDWVSGSSMIIRRQLLDVVGLMDEGFFLYFEEVDLFQRAAKAGWETWYVPESKVMHIEGASTGVKSVKRRPAYWYNSRRRYFIKHHGLAGLLLADLLWSLGRASFLVRRLLRLGAQGELTDPKGYCWDLLWGDLKAVLTGQAWTVRSNEARLKDRLVDPEAAQLPPGRQ
jgi:N-acetylglucosaminyl-diphospho-decaprenol L-rhamnosyltransferase